MLKHQLIHPKINEVLGKAGQYDAEIRSIIARYGLPQDFDQACRDQARQAVDMIMDKAKTGSIGDGKIFVVNIEEAIRVRTGESGDDAL